MSTLHLWLNRFLPKDWGVSLPVGVSVSGSITRPQLKNNTDVYLTSEETGHSDNLADMISGAAKMVSGKEKDPSQMTVSEHYEKQNINKTVFASYSKSTESENPFVNLTADRMSVDFKYNENINVDRQGPSLRGNGDYAISDTTDTYSGNLKYNLTPTNPPEWTKWKPMVDSKQSWIPHFFKEYEFSLLPEKLELDLADVSYGSNTGQTIDLQEITIIFRELSICTMDWHWIIHLFLR